MASAKVDLRCGPEGPPTSPVPARSISPPAMVPALHRHPAPENVLRLPPTPDRCADLPPAGLSFFLVASTRPLASPQPYDRRTGSSTTAAQVPRALFGAAGKHDPRDEPTTAHSRTSDGGVGSRGMRPSRMRQTKPICRPARLACGSSRTQPRRMIMHARRPWLV